MKRHSRKTQAIWAVVAMIMSYPLLVFQATIGLSILADVKLFGGLSFGIHVIICSIFIMLPLLLAKVLTNFKIKLLIFDPIIIFTLAMIYCPEGWYLLILRGFMFAQKSIGDVLLITTMMFLMHLLAFGLGGSIRYFINVCTKRKLR